MKKQVLLLLLSSWLIGLQAAVPEPIAKVLNTIQYWSDYWWQHQELHRLDTCRNSALYKRDIDGVEVNGPSPIEEIHDEMEEDPLPGPYKELPKHKVGVWVEGAGELADIASLTSTNPRLIKAANAIALASRTADVAMGSFPQLSRFKTQDPSGLRFWRSKWEHSRHIENFMAPVHIGTHLANQAGKVWDIQRAGNRIKNATLIAWYNKNFLSKGRRTKLHIMQAIHAAVLLASLIIKNKQSDKLIADRYPWLIGEAVISLLRRLHMRHIQTKMLNDARDEWEVAEEQTEEQGSQVPQS